MARRVPAEHDAGQLPTVKIKTSDSAGGQIVATSVPAGQFAVRIRAAPKRPGVPICWTGTARVEYDGKQTPGRIRERDCEAVCDAPNKSTTSISPGNCL